MKQIGRLLPLLSLTIALVLAGCATTAPQSRVAELQRDSPGPTIVLMPLDVELSEMTVGGMLEPRAEWTSRATELLVEGLRSEKRRLGFGLAAFSSIQVAPSDVEVLDQLGKLHAAVGKSILLHSRPELRLPNRGARFDWTLGSEASLLGKHSGADYALFVFIRDTYASDARKVAIVAGALLGMVLPAGTQLGFASLVELRTGDVVWFNSIERSGGDLRTPGPALESISMLLTGFPR